MDGLSIRKPELILRQHLNDMTDLGLQAQAARYFSFLVKEYGYRRTQSIPYLVRFESPTAFVELVYDGNRSFELNLLVGEMSSKASGSPPFSIDEILRFRCAPEAKQFALVQVTSKEVMASFVEQLAEMLRAYGGDFIHGNEQSFAEIAEQRRREETAYALKRDLRKAREEAELAWRGKDYSAVINALRPLRAILTAAEMAKLEFAEKQVGPAGDNRERLN